MAVYGYIRVSTAAQANDGESLDVQRRKLDGYAMQHGWTIDQVFVERGVSGGRPMEKRPKGRELLEALRTGDVVLASKLDRVFRSASDALRVLEAIKQQGVSLHLLDMGGDVTGNGIAQMVFVILSAVAEFERDRIAERIREVKADQKRRGRYRGGVVPFGWHLGDDGQLVEFPAQQEAIRRMVDMHRDGKSLRVISTEIKKARFTVSHQGVKKIIAAAKVREDPQRG